MLISIGPVHSQITENIWLARELMQYETSFYTAQWKDNPDKPGKKQQIPGTGKSKKGIKQLVSANGVFLTGFASRLAGKLKAKGIPINFNVLKQSPEVLRKDLSSMTLYPYQNVAVGHAITKKRGIIVAPTGSGKTAIGMGIARQFDKSTILWITPTIDLLNQTYNRFIEEFEDREVGIIGDSVFEPSRITIGIINSLHNMLKDGILKSPDLIIVDECHRISTFSGAYAKVLQSLQTTMRIGLTATPPHPEEAKYSLEGNIGPILHEVSQTYLTDIGKLAIPKVKIVRVPTDKMIANLRKYSDIYDAAVVNNKVRNELIADEIHKACSESNTCLVIVRILEHGANILEILNAKYPKVKAIYAHGATDSEEREVTRQLLEEKQIDCAITSTIWKEGVDIPSLNVVVNAAGSKSELFCLQVIGRGMRTSPGKDGFLIIDFFDASSHYLVNHFGHRLSIYFEKGWI